MSDERALKRPSGLGRGLSSLFDEPARQESEAGSQRSGVQFVAVARIDPHPDQPRRHFDEDALAELAASITARGVLQPIVVRPVGPRYQIIAGERRWRASQQAGLNQIPVVVRAFDDAETLEVSLLENIQRQDLNAIEEAEGYRRLMADYGHSAEALGKRVHKSRSHVANLLRLLDLPLPVRDALAEGRLSMGHARAIATAADPEAIAREVMDGGLSVRQTEARMQVERPRRVRTPKPADAEVDTDIRMLERKLSDVTGLRVTIAHGAPGGTVSLAYASLDQLDMICQRLSGEVI